MAKKLYYFNVIGLGEPIRYILHYAGENFEDARYPPENWPDPVVKDSLPYGQFPLYEEDGRSLNQSLAIARYVASKAKLLPSDPWEQAVLDAVVLTIYDFFENVRAYIMEKDPTVKEARKKKILSETVDFYFSRFENELKANKGFFNGELSWAEFVLTGLVDSTNVFLDTEVEIKYPTVKTLVQKIRSLPGVKEYIANRKPCYVTEKMLSDFLKLR